jgi:hypothetical protein
LHYRDDKVIIESCACFIPELRGTKRPLAEESDDGSMDDDGNWMGPGVTRRKAGSASSSGAAPNLTAEDLKGWVAKNLRLDAESTLQFGVLKNRMEVELKAPKKIPDLMMNSAGLFRAPYKNKTFVKDSENKRLGLRPQA